MHVTISLSFILSTVVCWIYHHLPHLTMHLRVTGVDNVFRSDTEIVRSVAHMLRTETYVSSVR